LSYILAIAFSILLSAVYAFQNAGDIYVKFLIFERSFPQGVWETLLFSAGILLMWIFSIFASLEGRAKYKSLIKERDAKIASMEEEKKALLAAFNRLESPPAAADSAVSLEETPSPDLNTATGEETVSV
jgi:uncharacterized integral membrane protein